MYIYTMSLYMYMSDSGLFLIFVEVNNNIVSFLKISNQRFLCDFKDHLITHKEARNDGL